MKLGLISLALLLCACSSAEKPSSTFVDSDASRVIQPDAGTPTPDPIVDAGVEEEAAPGYQSCATSYTRPVTTGSDQAQRCLTQVYCTDSMNQTYLFHLVDSCHGDMACDWGLACDGHTYCLPENDQSSPEYADDTCTKPIAFVMFKNGTPASKYVGLDQFIPTSDAGLDAGYTECRNIYTITTPWKDNGEMYYLAKSYSDPNSWECFPTYVNFPGLKLYYLSKDPINPATLFVQQ